MPSSTLSSAPGVEADFVEDCYMGNNAHGAANIGRQAALLAGMPVTTAGVTVNRFCSSGLQTIAMAANHIRGDGADCVVAGGVESISIPGGGMPREAIDPELMKVSPAIFMAMIDTADIVAKRYSVSREYAGRVLAGDPSAAWPRPSRRTSSRTKSSR